ncbi:saccharopine dehydrogenase [Desulfonema ishimotonii]|uniref:Saccharopine dehydrogenase n=1 Tax=Desulfonema ishimotonii TaxID=45657 RepID=A0A401FX78_9BACT|nr:saccharopine dehydrogenase C-terminal domain-containing protein [Desulfonema ishimotonii]GBC61587.1 saccharopine dehydrogenase [Desulfonema ishimotonii]
MNRILVLGAGFVARPLVRYLLDTPETELTVASRTLSRAENLLGGHPEGIAKALDVGNVKALRQTMSEADIVISLLPWVHHVSVAKLCLELGKHLVTTSYVRPEMAALDHAAKQKGLLFLNEIGVDPGIDHMAAMKIIDGVKQRGGEIVSFYSYCGGLPALSCNNNPLGYKFSWSPSGVLLAALNTGRYLRAGEVTDVPGPDLFRHYRLVDVPGAGTFETYVNRDALPYMKIYGIESATAMYRGTLRNIGHCESWHYFKALGLLDRERTFDFRSTTPRRMMAELAEGDGRDIVRDIAACLGIPEHAVTIKKLEWLGLLDDQPLPLPEGTASDLFAHVLEKKLAYAPGETDLLLQHHEFIARYPEGKKEKITATLIHTGIPDGDSAMSRTVGLPAAIATRMIAAGKIRLTGVHRPVVPEIHTPVLAELADMDIRFTEKKYDL